MRLIIAIALVLTGTQLSFAKSMSVDFADLPDPAAKQFVDPFREMGFELLAELRTVVQLDARLAKEDLAPEARERLAARRDSARRMLRANGYDIEELLAQRWVIAERRKRALFATNPALDGAEVTISGYLIPAGRGPARGAFGYLVAQIGMCSHLPTPPPNELVRLRFDPSMLAVSMYRPVRVSGKIRVQISDETITLLDGKVRMISSWHLDAQSVVAASTPTWANAPNVTDITPARSAEPERPDPSLN